MGNIWIVFVLLACLAATCCGAAQAQEARLWAADSLTKVLRNALPPPGPVPLRLEGARGETLSGQAVFRAPADIAGVRAEMTELKGSGGAITASRLRLQWVRYIDVKRNTAGVPEDELVAKAPCALPDPYWDTPEVRASADTAQPLWIEADLPSDTVPGDYSGTLTLRWQGGEASLPVNLTVWDFAVPVARHQQVTNWFTFPGAGYEVTWDSEPFWKLAAQCARMMVSHRQTCFVAQMGWIKTTYDPQAGYRCDFRFLDRWAETFFAAGLDRMEMFQAGAVTASVDNPACRVLPADLSVEVKAPGVTLTPEEKLRGVLEQLEKHLREKGWAGRVMMHVADEPFLHGVPTYRQVAAIVHQAAPSLKVIEAVEATGFGDAIDVLVPKLSHLNLWLPYFEKEKKAGREVWFYTCCHPVGRYPNRFLDQPLVKARALHWIGYLYGLDGYLHWGLNYFAPDVDPYTEEGLSKDLPLGDRAIMYPGRNGPVGSLRWSAMRDGLQDYEYLRLLEDRLAALKQRLGDRADWLDPRQRSLELCRRVVTSFYEHTRNPSDLLEARRQVAAEIEALAKPLLLYVQTEPCEGTAVPAGPRMVNVRGIAEPGATVRINGMDVKEVGPDGVFAAACFLFDPTVTVEATRNGTRRAVTRTFRLVD